MPGLHVVVGAARPLGGAVVQRLRTAGEKTRAVVPDPSRLPDTFDQSVEVAVANFLAQESLARACSGATMIYNCFESPYSKRQELLPLVNSNLLLTAINERASYAVVSHIYNSELDNQTVEDDALEGQRARVAGVVVARVPQLYGPGVVNDLFTDVFRAAIEGKKAHWAGNMEVPRSMVYILDAADAIVELAASQDAYGRAWAIAGPGPITGKEFIEMAFRAAQRYPRLQTGIRERIGLERISPGRMPYDYGTPFVLDGTGFSMAFPGFNFTSHDIAIAETLEWFEGRLVHAHQPTK